MTFELQIIEFLQKASFLDWPAFILTFLGDELFFIALVAVLYWCYDKRVAFRMANVYFVSVGCTDLIKNAVRRPRPYTRGGIRGGEGDLGHTGGFSFPSGHSQSIGNLSAQLFLESREKRAHTRKTLWIGIVAVLIVMFTRVYLGQHYLTDVLTGAALGIGLAVLFTFLFRFLGEHEERLFFVIAPLCIALYAIFEAVGIASDMTDVVKVLGAYAAFTAGYFCEKRYIKYNVRSDKKYKYALKILLGLAVTLALKELLKLVFLDFAFFHFLRYFITALWASLLAPLCFQKLKL